MTLKNYIDYDQTNPITAAWLNAIDAFYVTLFQESTTAADARAALGSTTVGDAVFVAVSAAAARAALGSTVTGDALFVTASAAAARSTLSAAQSGANTDITSLSAPALGAATATTQAVTDSSTKVATTATVHAADVIRHGQCQLQYVSGTSIKLMPYDGQYIQIAGVLYPIPATGIASGNPTGANNWVNGVASQTLAVSTVYYVSVFNNSGTLALGFWTTATGHSADATAGNVGVEIITAHADNTMIGMIVTSAASQFLNSATARGVRSWFNDTGISVFGNLTVNRACGSVAWVEIHSEARVGFLAWPTDTSHILATAMMEDGADGTTMYLGVGIDSTSAVTGGACLVTLQNGIWDCATAGGAITGFTEGLHYATMLGGISGGSAPVYYSGSHISGHIGHR